MRPVTISILWVMFILALAARSQANSPPFIQGLNDYFCFQGEEVRRVFAVWDEETPADQLSLRLESSDPAVLPAVEVCATTGPGFCFGGSGTNRSLSLQLPGCNSGTALLRVIVTDELGAAATNSFFLTVQRHEYFVLIVPIPDQFTWESASSVSIPVRITSYDPCNGGEITVSANSSDQLLVPDSNIALVGSKTNWTMTITPAAQRFGRATIRVIVSDDLLSTRSTTFAIVVNARLESGWADGTPVLRWTVNNGVLQQASSLSGLWQDLVPAPVSPYVLSGTATKYYRLRAK